MGFCWIKIDHVHFLDGPKVLEEPEVLKEAQQEEWRGRGVRCW
jgi:hypothetical protein